MIKRFRDEYLWLSNMTPVKITYKGIEYASTEHAYMSAKSDDMEWKSRCADHQITAKQIKRESKGIELVDNWDEIKIGVMTEVINLKFSQEPFRTLLLETKLQEIIEGNYWNDTFWGVCDKTGKGENNLGKIIMKKREDLFDDIIDLWHQSTCDIPLHEFMGLTENEYKKFVNNENEK